MWWVIAGLALAMLLVMAGLYRLCIAVDNAIDPIVHLQPITYNEVTLQEHIG